jgi:hypothetical protein
MGVGTRTGQLELRLLDDVRVLPGERVVSSAAWEHRRAADLVELSALAPEHRVARDQVLELSWPQLPPAAAERASELFQQSGQALDAARCARPVRPRAS